MIDPNLAVSYTPYSTLVRFQDSDWGFNPSDQPYPVCDVVSGYTCHYPGHLLHTELTFSLFIRCTMRCEIWAQLSCIGSSAGRVLCLECRVSWVRVPPEAAYLRKSDCLECAVLLCLVVSLTLLASFFLPSHLSLTCVHCHAHLLRYTLPPHLQPTVNSTYPLQKMKYTLYQKCLGSHQFSVSAMLDAITDMLSVELSEKQVCVCVCVCVGVCV